MSIPSPQPLTPALIDEYRTLMTRVEPDHWDALRHRGETAKALATRAFVHKDRAAWEVAQVVEWRLQRQNSLRPSDPGDVLVLDTLYRIEELNSPRAELPQGLSAKQFCDKLTEDTLAFRVDTGAAIQLIHSGKLALGELRYFCFQFVPPAIDFTKMIALASMSLPRDVARFTFENLYEEGGKGDWDKAHIHLLTRFLADFDIDINDGETVLSWVPPEALASSNAQNRMLWHREAGWALGSMFLMEKLLPLEHTPFRDGLLASGARREAMTFFDVHIEGEAHHAADWLKIAEMHLHTYEDQRVAYVAAMDRGRWYKICWEALYQGYCQWKETGKAPCLPARGLRDATGM